MSIVPPATPMPDNAPTLSPLKRAFLALEEAQARLAHAEGAAREPIAVIGLGCRVPGADDPAAFWRLLAEGRDAMGPIPRGRFDIDAYFDPDPEVPGRIAVREAGFIRDVEGFDAGFFGISPREANGMDPQQRLLLEVSWEALEHAGQAPDRLERSATGVYFGVASNDYCYLQIKSGDATLLDSHYTSGIAHSVASGRISYLLGLQGPSLTIDTACSSSLVAVHLACQALRAGECRMALAGGVNLMLSADLFIAFSHSRMLAPDGRCKTFDAAADGFARGEGCGVVVLKRLADAQADGDRILAVIRGSAVNQDGPSSGLTAPNGPAQEAVIHEALVRAAVTPAEVGFIEAHGTGTQLGDPLEVRALGQVFGTGRDAAHPLRLASVKTNIGHLEAAAGVTGLIKVVLALQHRAIPAHLHFKSPSPHIAWAELPFEVPTALQPWQSIGGRRIAGVSSFGFSGTNAHVVLGEAPVVAQACEQVPGEQIYTLSAQDERALRVLAKAHSAALEGTNAPLASLCFSANVGRARFAQRATVVADSVPALREGLDALAHGQETPVLRSTRLARRDPPRVAFLFTGQGAQYPDMAHGLYDGSPAFRAALDRCAQVLDARLPRPLLSLLFSAPTEPSLLDRTECTQPALFAVEYALAELWRSWGVVPMAVIGHSVGELVAACVAGVMSLDDALALVAERGRLMGSLPGGGAMAAIAAGEAEVLKRIAPVATQVAIAAVNAPDQTVVSGVADAVDALCREFEALGVRCQRLAVSHAFHSPLVEPVLAEFEQAASRVDWSAPRIRLVSNLTGAVADPGLLTQAGYWRRHVRESVRFADGVRSLAQLRPDLCIEIGPHPALLTFVASGLGDGAPVLVPSLRKGRPDRAQILDALATAHLQGVDVDWRAVHSGQRVALVELPTYPFRRERCWFSARTPTANARGRATGHPLLGTRVRSATAERVYEARFSIEAPRFVAQHRVLGQIVLPATAYLEALLAAAHDTLGPEARTVQDVAIQEALRLADDPAAGRTMQLVLEPARDGMLPARVCSLADDAGADADWTCHVTARLSGAAPTGTGVAATALAEARESCTLTMDGSTFYADLARRGLAFGPAFQSVRQVWRGNQQALGEVELHADLHREAPAYRMHPVLLDGCLQVMAAAMVPDGEDALYLPMAIGRYTLHRRGGERCWVHVVADAQVQGATRRADMRVFDASGALVAELADVRLKRVARDALERLGERRLEDSLYEVVWQDAPRTTAPSAAVTALNVTDMAAAATAASDRLRREAGLDAFDSMLPRLDALCVDFIQSAFRTLGWTPSPGERVDEGALAERLGVIARHRRLLGRFLAILAEAGVLARDGSGWRVQRALGTPEPSRELAQLATVGTPIAAEFELTGRSGSALAEALRGACDPLQLLFPGGSTETAERVYRDSPPARVFNAMVGEAVAAAARGRSAGRPLRILELGAGTGGTTAHVLPRLPAEGVEYCFTDVGALFVARAIERFGPTSSFMRFEVLDLEREPEEQGFAGRCFDLILASNVIHATRDLRRTLARVRRLLAPGGALVLLEATAPQAWFDLTVGLTEGWWCFEDHDLRPDYATLGSERWRHLLIDCGFGAVAVVAGDPAQRGAFGLNALLIAQAGAPPEARDWLIYADSGGVAAALAERLRARGDRCTLAHAGAPRVLNADECIIDPACSDDHRALLANLREVGRRVHGVVHAGSLDVPAWDDFATEDLDRARRLGVVSALHAAQALAVESPTSRLWLLSGGAQQADAAESTLNPAQAPLWGLGKSLALELPELRSVCIDLDPGAAPALIGELLAEFDEAGDEAQVALRAGTRRVARLTHLMRTPVATGEAPFRVIPTQPGALDGFERAELRRHPPGPGEVEIAIEASGVNFKDVLNVLGMYPGDPGPLGGECAGRVVAVGAGVERLRPGDEVLALAGGCLASHVTTRAEFVQARPPGMGAEEGASFPIAFLTARFCLEYLGELRAGERVLIHAAAGGVGMAAVRLAMRAGAEIFATAGSESKRALLRAMGVAHVMDSRSTLFAAEIAAATGGRGVDLVLNSLAGDAIEASFAALAEGGRFVEIGKRGIKGADWVAAKSRGWRYHVVDWGETAQSDPLLIGGMLAELVEDLRRGTLCTLPRHVFALDDAPRAFRFMTQARHAGKIVLRHGAPAPVSVRRDGSYLVTGGLSGLGPVVARWLAERGAGRIVLVGRRGATPDTTPLLDSLRAHGCTVLAEALDVTDADALGALLARLRAEGPPLRGVIHSAGVLDDAMLAQQDDMRFARVFAPKLQGATLLDRLTRADALDWFVLFSSAAAVLGSAGQSNHSAANTFLDLLARERHAQGLPGLSINWGAWSTVGAAVDRSATARIAQQGLSSLTPEQGLAALDRLIGQDHPQVAVLPMDWPRYLEHLGRGAAPPFLSIITKGASGPAASPTATVRTPELRERLTAAAPGRRRALMAAFVRERALRALGVDPARAVDPRTPLGELGMDSLLAVELRNTLGHAVGRTLPATLLFDYPTIDTLTDFLLKELFGAPGANPASVSKPGLVSSIEELSDAEVERQLAARVRRKN